ncbi:extracellular solute-binding protein [Butyrivibrio sp. FC2001]|uniref:extracellular solute-binding protein n=1 Tax=Butyrivibrio sp. FC2001 TaxID=1280671 RepID=UPI0004030D83|nr:extracellular solute-binding protein [Butyrivibrio sp. FC2001]
MKRIYLKRILSISLATVMTLNMAACGCGKKSNTSSTADEEAGHDATAFVFKETAINLGEGVDLASISALGSYGDKVYALYNSVGDDGSNQSTLYTFDKDGSNVTPISLPMKDNLSVANVAVASDGSIYTVETQFAGMGGGFDFSSDDGGMSGDMGGIIEGGDIEIDTDSSDSDSVVDDIDQYSGEDGDVEVTDAEDTSDATDATSDSESTDADAATTESADGTGDAATEGDGTTTEESADNYIDISNEEVLGGDTAESDVYYMVKHDSTGAEVWRNKLDTSADSYFYINSFLLADDSTLLTADANGMHKYNTEDGSLAGDFEASEVLDSEYGGSVMLYKLGDGNFGAMNAATAEFYKVDVNAGTLTAVEGSENPFYDYTFYSGAGSHDFFAVGSEGVYTYNMGDANVSMILNFVDSDINTYGLSNLAAISDEEMVALIPSDDSGYTLSYLTKVDPKAVGEKQQITLGCNYIDYKVRAQIISFNKKNDKYRIVINDYSKYDSDDDYSGGANRLNTDIVSGNAPDILVLDADMPVDSYISKGLFEDMTDYFNNDEELSKIKFMDHVMEAFKTDGKMYKIIPSFYVETVVAPKKDVGDDYTWTIDELEKIVKEKNIEHKNIFGPLARDEVFEMALSLAGSQYIDWTTLTCSYNSEAFIHLLEFVNEFPEELEEDDYYNDTSAYWRQGLSLGDRFYLNGFSDYNYEKKGTFGEDITTVGFPSDNGSGSALYPNLQLTMNASSKVKDGCWEFMRYFLTDDFQKTIDDSWPVSMNMMDKLSADAKKKPTYVDENGKEVEYDDTWYIGETEIIIDPMTDDEINEVINFLNSIDQVGNANEEVTNIIYEEASAYFSGQKTAEEVADIIQSRVQIYVNEIS